MPRIKVYYAEPFDDSTEIDVNDTFLGDGSTTTFTLSQKTNNKLAATVQASNIQYYYYNGGFTKENTYEFTLNSAPANGVGIVAPGLSYLPFRAYDTDNIDGVDEPRVHELPFYYGNPDDIHTNTFTGAPGICSIRLTVVDHVSGDVIADETWVELASATQDLDGTAMTYVTGEFHGQPFTAFCTLLCSVSAGGSTIYADTEENAADFIIGDYIVINRGGVTEERRKLLAVTDNEMTITELAYGHSAGETVYDAVRKAWGKMTVPDQATDGIATAFYNVGLRIEGTVESRF